MFNLSTLTQNALRGGFLPSEISTKFENSKDVANWLADQGYKVEYYSEGSIKVAVTSDGFHVYLNGYVAHHDFAKHQ